MKTYSLPLGSNNTSINKFTLFQAQGALVSVSASMRRIDDYTSNRIFFDGLRWVFIPVNEGRATTRTLELETRFPLKSLFDAAPAIDLRASVSFVRNGLVRVTGNRTFYSEARTDLAAYAAWKITPKQELRLALWNLHGEDNGFAVSYADPVAGLERRRWRYPGTLRVQAGWEVGL